MHILGVELEEFLVQSSAPRELSQLNLQVNVAAEQLGLGALAQGGAERAPGGVNLLLPDLELRVQQPQLGEGELLVRQQLERRAVHLPRPLRVLGLQLLVDGVVDPELDVKPPVVLLTGPENDNR